MLTVDGELSRLKLTMSMSGIPHDMANEVEREARLEITKRIYTALDGAMQRAQAAGEESRSEDFIEQLTAVKIGDGFRVMTDSGKTDFSSQPFPMLPSLLKNGKIAKDGSVYKVIPIAKKSKSVTTANAAKSMNRARREMRNEINNLNDGNTSHLDNMINRRNKVDKQRSKRSVSDINFRTVSSKQDASNKWIHPGHKADMTNVLREINDELFQEVQLIIREVISKYEGVL